MLSGNTLTKRYGDVEIIHTDVSIEPGAITTLIGPSGAGKTTLLNLLSFVDHPDTGEININGRLYRFPEETISAVPRPDVVMVFQQLFLWPHLTLRENILLPHFKKKTAPKKQLEELIVAFGMSTFIDRYPNETSLGQRQRAALARAILLNPSYLLLDEVTSALDIEQVAAVANYLEKLKEQGTGIFVVTHLIHFAQKISDHILFMDKGQILERGGKDLIHQPQQKRTKEFLKYF